MMTATCCWHSPASPGAPRPFAAASGPAAWSPSGPRPRENFQWEQARARSESATRPSIAASAPKRYGTGDCHGERADDGAAGPWAMGYSAAPGLIGGMRLVFQ
ncbi:hypothetical protein BRADI_3g05811v3 [Brachypodium distachyon]|uniref:Uncharacterized protein n=1 Tax=Brachypodium distachyon TaxID=15368 RepID=A0A0Q3HJU1_BRADI|nr:hypothetical protein BRADI_3g05811v3 [Brachypodium distachyon]